MPDSANPLVAIAMGSKSDWETMKPAADMLDRLGIPYVTLITSAHRTPVRVRKLAESALAGYVRIIIAGAGGAAHLPGLLAADALTVPIIGVPVESRALKGMDSLLSIVQMPTGVPVGTMAIGGAANAAIYAAQMLAISDPQIRQRLIEYRFELANSVPETPYEEAKP